MCRFCAPNVAKMGPTQSSTLPTELRPYESGNACQENKNNGLAERLDLFQPFDFLMSKS